MRVKKNFYVDGHKRPNVVKYREEYIKQYLIDEQRMYRWIQIERTKFYELVSQFIVCITLFNLKNVFHYY